ncbi:MAG: MSEP-CTERM sorting domain-containing protein, partial [Verrucomicrobiota bacterium]
RALLQRSLTRLQRSQDGLYLPLLSEAYESLTFDGLVLGESKARTLWLTFFARERAPEKGSSRGQSLFPTRTSQPRRVMSRRSPPRKVTLHPLEVSTNEKEGCLRTLVKLRMTNRTEMQSEFVTAIHLPPGTSISGYWLQVGEERVPGQIIEKKAAMWVYRMIRDARKDPGILTYQTPHQVELRVFPFAGKETRITEIEFLSPISLRDPIQIGNQIVGEPRRDSHILHAKTEQEAQAILAPSALLPTVLREPYLHFLVERSEDAENLDQTVRRMIEFSESSFPSIKKARVSNAHFDSREVTEGTIPISELSAITPSENWLTPQGGFLATHALKRALIRFQANQSPAEIPLFVLVRTTDSPMIEEGSLAFFQHWLPDLPIYLTLSSQGDSTVQSFLPDSEDLSIEELTPTPVHLFRSGSQLIAAPSAEGSLVSAFLPSLESPEIYSKEEKTFRSLDSSLIPAPTPWKEAASTHHLSRILQEAPFRSRDLLPQVVNESRTTGILTPFTSYIVVENSAQWKMLKRKEKEKLKGNHGLDFMETPAPMEWLLGLLFACFLAIKKALANRQTRSA